MITDASVAAPEMPVMSVEMMASARGAGRGCLFEGQSCGYAVRKTEIARKCSGIRRQTVRTAIEGDRVCLSIPPDAAGNRAAVDDGQVRAGDPSAALAVNTRLAIGAASAGVTVNCISIEELRAAGTAGASRNRVRISDGRARRRNLDANPAVATG